ncbi:MAG: peptidylprolyl isomerase [Ruminococcus sp.]|nr:peptidylprolyl isomerase [Ruminococcus sp.]
MCFSGCSDKTEESFVITLYPEYAPITVDNFVSLVEDGFYDGLTFHRIVEGFVAQGGDPNGDGTGGSDETIKGEFIDNGVTTNTMSHQRGVVSMARNSTSYDSASSQFFICYADCSSALDGQYAAFGKIDDEGMEVVDKFLDIEREYSSSGELSVPTTPITIEKAEVISDSSDGHQRVRMTVSF